MTLLLVLFFTTMTSAAELHWSICEPNIETILAKIDGNSLQSQRRQVYFFDQLDLDLFRNQIIVRVRESAKKVVLTLKIELPATMEQPLMECEIDRIGDLSRRMCSLDVPLTRERWNAFLNSPEGSVRDLLSPEQLKLVVEKLGSEPAWSQILTLGPSELLSVDIRNNSLNRDLTLERVTHTRGLNVFELSTRTPDRLADFVFSKMNTDFKSLRLNLCAEQKSKTELILTNLIDK